MHGAPGTVAEWLRSGLQSRVHQFKSGRCLSLWRARRASRFSPVTRAPSVPRDCLASRGFAASLRGMSARKRRNVADEPTEVLADGSSEEPTQVVTSAADAVSAAADAVAEAATQVDHAGDAVVVEAAADVVEGAADDVEAAADAVEAAVSAEGARSADASDQADATGDLDAEAPPADPDDVEAHAGETDGDAPSKDVWATPSAAAADAKERAGAAAEAAKERAGATADAAKERVGAAADAAKIKASAAADAAKEKSGRFGAGARKAATSAREKAGAAASEARDRASNADVEKFARNTTSLIDSARPFFLAGCAAIFAILGFLEGHGGTASLFVFGAILCVGGAAFSDELNALLHRRATRPRHEHHDRTP